MMKRFDINEKIEEVKQVYAKSLEKAQSFYGDKNKLDVLVEESIAKGKRTRIAIKAAWEYLQVFYCILKDQMNGVYTSFPKDDTLKVIAGLIYFVSPIDVFPDFVPIFGLIDDGFVLSLVAAAVGPAIQAYHAEMEKEQLQN